MLTLAIFAGVVVPPPAVRVEVVASVLVVRSGGGSQEEWLRAPVKHRREIVVDERGKKVVVRAIEYE